MAFGLATIGLVSELYYHFFSLGICLQQYNQADLFRPITGLEKCKDIRQKDRQKVNIILCQS
jgi:hypothetical protein